MVYYKTIEILFGSLVIAPFYIVQKQEIPIFFYLLLTILSTYLFIFLIHKYQEKSKLLFFITVFPIIVIGGIGFGFSIFFVLFLSMFIYWRTTIMNSESDSVQTGIWLFLTIFCGFILLIFANIQDYPLYQPMIISIILQLAFILIGGFMINWLSMVGNKLEKRLLLRNFLSIMGMIIAISLLIVTFRDVLKWLVVSILQLVVFVASLPLSPLFKWAENFELTREINPFAQIQNAESQVETEDTSFIDDQSLLGSKMDFNFTYLAIVVFIILIIMLFIFLYKKFQGGTEILDTAENGYFISSLDEKEMKRNSKDKRLGEQPSYRVRKEIYRLEKMAEKLQLSRNSSETIGEWFKRVGVKEDEFIQTVYERVRYGNQFESDEDYRLFLKSIDTKKNELKQIHKLLVEEGKIKSTSRVKNMIKGFTSKTEEH